MIYIYPVGGLGNMFFHIASIYSLAKDNDDELCLLNVDAKISNLISDTRCELKHSAKYKYIFNRFKCINANIAQSDVYPFNYSQLQYINGHRYEGYFQCEKYFKHRRSEILELFKPADEFNVEINKYSQFFGNISMHVRRGDYVKLYPQIHIPQTVEYYQKALALLPIDMKVLIFSDDMVWCKEHFTGERFVFVPEIDYIAIYIMTKMKHHIIANSSFSWWGAWLSEYNDKKIIAPKNWFGEKPVNFDADLIPKDWIKI